MHFPSRLCTSFVGLETERNTTQLLGHFQKSTFGRSALIDLYCLWEAFKNILDQIHMSEHVDNEL